jgi:hypothetical protein
MRHAVDLDQGCLDIVPLELLTNRFALHLRHHTVEFLLELLEARGGLASLAALFQETANASRPRTAGAMTLFTAFVTPFPPNRFLSPSRSSRASRLPVDAPKAHPRGRNRHLRA